MIVEQNYILARELTEFINKLFFNGVVSYDEAELLLKRIELKMKVITEDEKDQ